MPANAVVRARIDARVKEEATAIYAAETVEAMKAARRGELTTIGSIDNLLADLHADD